MNGTVTVIPLDAGPSKLFACAKINLALKVGRRRDDGYHEIDSVMHSVSLYDEICIEDAPQLTVTTDSPLVPGGVSNLAYRAAQCLRARCPNGARGASITIRKGIPVAAGLGGGSSDAAAVLVELNRRWRCDYSREGLAELGKALGADVPFCIYGGAALVQGIGEQVRPLPPLDAPVILIAFEAGLSTAEVYRRFDAAGGVSRVQVEPVLEAMRLGDLAALGRALANDLESVVTSIRPEVEAARRDLLACGAVGARMSGSGPTVFGLFADPERARLAWRTLRRRWPGVHLCRLVARGLDSAGENSGPRGWTG